MPQSTFIIATDQLVTNAPISSNGTFDIYTSSTVNNTSGLPSLRLVVEYSQITPNDTQTNVAAGFRLGVVVESQYNGFWLPVAYQYESYFTPNNGDKRIILLQPDISTFDSGIDDIMYIGGSTVARISRQQGKLGSNFRVRIICYENGFGVPNAAFQSVHLNIYGEIFDV